MSREYNNYGRDQINIENIQGNLVVHKQERPRNEQILLKAVRDEVETRLASSLHNAVFLNLGKEAQSDQVRRPWDSEIKIGVKAAQAQPDNITIVQIFESPEIKGKLLILGQQGSGKTTTLLDLAKTLVEKAEADSSYPIPVLFNLSSWQDEKQLIRDWIVTELRSKYSVSTKLGQHWVAKQALLPLLDGLDEVAPERQEKCVEQINTFLTGESSPLYAVVCSWIAEYQNYKTKLQLNGAIYLKELSEIQMQEYLSRVGRGELWSYISQHEALLEFIRTPLLLSMAILAYPQGSIAQWQQLQTAADPLQVLLDAYVEQMLHREFDSRAYGKNIVPTIRQTRWWLTWLAQKMNQTSQTEFLIEDMQPSMLPVGKQKQYRLLFKSIIGLIFGIAFGLNVGAYWGALMGFFGAFVGIKESYILIIVLVTCIIFGLIAGLIFGLIAGLIFGLIVGLIFGLINGLLGTLINKKNSRINSVEVIVKFSWKVFLIVSLAVGLIVGVISTSISGTILVGTAVGLIFGLLGGLLFTVIYELKFNLIDVKLSPNNRIKRSVTSSIIFGLSFGLLGWLVIWYKGWVSVGIFLSLVFRLHIWLGIDTVKVKDPPYKRIKISIANILTFILCFLFILVWPNDALWYFLIPISMLISGLNFGGTICIQHFALRLLLYQTKLIPWNYARFLDYSAERLLIQRVRGRYRFVHKLLQDHFARMPIDQ